MFATRPTLAGLLCLVLAARGGADDQEEAGPPAGPSLRLAVASVP